MDGERFPDSSVENCPQCKRGRAESNSRRQLRINEGFCDGEVSRWLASNWCAYLRSNGASLCKGCFELTSQQTWWCAFSGKLMIRNYKTVTALLIVLMLVLSAIASALGQGGTGRE